jgi:hypothetical protein
MNSAMDRRLALGDRVIWMGTDDCQPSGPGTITRITAHQVEVLWEGETARLSPRATAGGDEFLLSKAAGALQKERNVKRCPQSRQVERYAHGCR